MSNRLDPYWMVLAHAKNFTNTRKMEFLIDVVHGKMPLDEALQKVKQGDTLNFAFSDKELSGLREEVDNLPNYAFLSENLTANGVDCINVMDEYVYPKTLKKNLRKAAPIIVYAKGNLALLKKECVAVVGARNSSDVSLTFTDTVVRKAVRCRKVVVSGFAKGVDQRALDSAIALGGQSVIVLPQGIETYSIKKYYPKIVSGDVLVISTYHPKTPWSVGLAMDRNKTIYGLADEIYAAESNDSGGTWEGVRDGLKRGRKVYVRLPDPMEKNANQLLIDAGAVAVDLQGEVVAAAPYQQQAAHSEVHESPATYGKAPSTAEEIIPAVEELLNRQGGKSLRTAEIAEHLHLSDSWKKRLGVVLNKSPKFSGRKVGKEKVYSIAVKQSTLF